MPQLPHLSAIEFPGVLRDPNDPSRAIDALGGPATLRAYIATPPSPSSPRLSLNLRPSNHVSQSNITADPPRPTTNLFLLRLHPPHPPTLVARVTTFTEFRALSDYQYHPDPCAIQPYLSAHALPHNPHTPDIPPYAEPHHSTAVAQRVYHALIHRPAQHLSISQCLDRLRPARFARPAPERGTTNYWYRQYVYHPPNQSPPNSPPPLVFRPGLPLGNDRRSEPNRLSRLPHRVSYATESVPKNAPARPTVIRGRAAFTKLVALLRLLFQQRPIWVRRALLLGVPDELRTSFNKAIASVAYSFQGTGAFFQACVKYGYDPRKDPDSVQYQVIEVRCAHPIYEAVRLMPDDDDSPDEPENPFPEDEMHIENQKAGLSRVTLDLFKMPKEFVLDSVPRKRNNFFQVCDIKLEKVQQVIAEQTKSTVYDSKNGFFSEEGQAIIMRAIKSELFKLSRQIIGEQRTNEIARGDYRSIQSLMARRRGRLLMKDVLKSGEVFSQLKEDNEREQSGGQGPQNSQRVAQTENMDSQLGNADVAVTDGQTAQGAGASQAIGGIQPAVTNADLENADDMDIEGFDEYGDEVEDEEFAEDDGEDYEAEFGNLQEAMAQDPDADDGEGLAGFEIYESDNEDEEENVDDDDFEGEGDDDQDDVDF